MTNISEFSLIELASGIRKKNINILKMLNIYGMAGISFLKKNRPKNLGRFL